MRVARILFVATDGIAPALRGGAMAVALLIGCAESQDLNSGPKASVAAPTMRPPAQGENPSQGGQNPAAPAAGSASQPTAGASSPPQDPGMQPSDPVGNDPEPTQAMDECDLDTGWAGDEYCIDPPPAADGFQLHIGPTDYENPDPQYVLEPGEEMTNNFTAVSGNEQEIFFLYRQFRMRPGSHHMIITAGGQAGSGTDAGFGGRRIGTSNSSVDSPVGGIIAPENEGVGIPLAARASLNVSLHSINVSDEAIIREIWVNFWYRDPESVTETAQQLFATGDPSFVVQPGEDTILGPYTCDIQAEGRMLWFYGHRHANNRRFSAWRVRDGRRDLFYEGLHWEEPLLLEYTSLIQNPVPDRARGIEGGWSGILDVRPGDQLEWECHVVNELQTPLRFTNNTYTGEMCIMDAELVGTNCSSAGGFLPPTP
jgi:hypothetical protein